MSYSIPITNTNNTLPNTPYLYQLQVAGYGAEAKMAPISEPTAQYWSKIDELSFGAHFLDDDKSLNEDLNGSVIDPHAANYCRYVKGPELHENFIVAAFSVVDGEQVWGLAVEDIHDLKFKASYDPTFFRIAEPNRSYAVGRTFEAISSQYNIQTAEPFDPDLLELQFVWFSGTQILQAVQYDGVDVELDHQCCEIMQPTTATLISTVH